MSPGIQQNPVGLPMATSTPRMIMPKVRSRRDLLDHGAEESDGNSTTGSEGRSMAGNGGGSSRILRAETDLDRICRAAHVVCDGRGNKTLGEAMSEIRMMSKVWQHQEAV
jgi:hypothetical protein